MLKTIEQKVLRFIDERHLMEEHEKVLVAFSGGADSVFLLHFLFKYKRRLGINLAAFHLNHKLRGKEADADESFCRDFCSHRNVEFKSISRDIKLLAKKKKKSIEEIAREVRYFEMLKTAEKLKADKIATAHNSSDNAETVLLNLVKGTGMRGLTGIPAQRENIIRPVLCLTSEEIRNYLRSNKISYRFDKSNLNIDYERNYLRNEIIPKLKSRLNPQLEEKITSTSRIIKDVNDFIVKEVFRLEKTIVEYTDQELRIDLEKLRTKDHVFKGILLKTLLEKYFKIELNIDNIRSLIELINNQSGKKIHLKGNVNAVKDREFLVIERAKIKSEEKVNKKIRIGQKAVIDGKVISIEKVDNKNVKFNSNKFVEFISGDLVKGSFEIRRWKTGDKFNPIGMKGTKKISDFLSDEKTPSYRKEEQKVLTNSGKIVWVIGLRMDDKFKVTSGTKKILKLSVSGF